MNTPRLPIVIMTAALLSTVILALLTYRNTIKAVGNSPSSPGMGDLHFYDAQQSNESEKAQEMSHPHIGMGDLRRFEALASSRSNNGMGDLHRFEYGQLLATTNVSSLQLPARLCPNLSTSYGERDAGTSAPDYVLRASGCLKTQ